MTFNMQNMAHMDSPRYQQESDKKNPLSKATMPTRKSETAKERMRRLLGLWRCLGERNHLMGMTFERYHYHQEQFAPYHKNCRYCQYHNYLQNIIFKIKILLRKMIKWAKELRRIKCMQGDDLCLKCEIEMMTSRLSAAVRRDMKIIRLLVSMIVGRYVVVLLQDVFRRCGKHSSPPSRDSICRDTSVDTEVVCSLSALTYNCQ